MVYFRSGLLERMPMMKDNPDSPEVFNNVPNGEVTPVKEPAKGMFENFY